MIARTCLVWFGFFCYIRWFRWVLYVTGLFQAETSRYVQHKVRVCENCTLSHFMLAKLSSQALSWEKPINPLQICTLFFPGGHLAFYCEFVTGEKNALTYFLIHRHFMWLRSMCWELEMGIKGIRHRLSSRLKRWVPYWETSLSIEQHGGWNPRPRLCATSIRLCWLEGEWFSSYTEFLFFWFFSDLNVWGISWPLQVAQLYWLPIFNIAIYITLSRSRKLPLNTANSQVVFDVRESVSLGKYVQQTFS